MPGVEFGLSCDRFGVEFGLSCNTVENTTTAASAILIHNEKLILLFYATTPSMREVFEYILKMDSLKINAYIHKSRRRYLQVATDRSLINSRRPSHRQF